MCDHQSLRSACEYAQSDQSLCLSLEYSMMVKLLTEHHLEFLSLKEGCRDSFESTHVKMPHCWKSHALAHLVAYVLKPIAYFKMRMYSPESYVFCSTIGAQCVTDYITGKNVKAAYSVTMNIFRKKIFSF